MPVNRVDCFTQPDAVNSGAEANCAELYHYAENGYFSHKARIRYPQWLARLPGQYSPEGTGSAIHYDLNTMAMKRFKKIPYVILFLNDQPVRVGCNTSQLTGLGKRKIIADWQVWVACCHRQPVTFVNKC